MSAIYVYEVELKVTDKSTRTSRLTLRTEHAYSLMDAVHQAVMNIAPENAGCDIQVNHVGPPSEAIHVAFTGLGDQVASVPAGIAKRYAAETQKSSKG